MAATTRKRKSHASAKSKKAKAFEVDCANDGAAKADAEAGASEGEVIDTPISSADNTAGPPPVSAVEVDNETALTSMITAKNVEDKDANAVVAMTTTTTSATDEYSPLPARGEGDNEDATVIADKAPYPNKGVAFGSTTMITATKGGVEDKEENKIILCANPSIDSGQDLKMLAWDRLMRGGGGVGQEGVCGWDGKNGGYGGALGLVYSSCGGPSVKGKTTRKSPPEELLLPSSAVRDKATLALGDAI